MQKSLLYDPARVIDAHIREVGLKKTAVARRAGLSHEALCRSLAGRRTLKADELLSLMLALGLGVEAFMKAPL